MLYWCLEGFDPVTERLVQEHHLTRLNEAAIRAILNVDDGIPVEPFCFHIPNIEAVRALAAYADEPVLIDDTLIYQLGCYAPG